ncbi:unnamed protein product [Danaus chrysippus]|uniref:(African queen) hypothetical protein n=1 Tax=Danaus chrysippus TaxID=151541 RepID=A0A8J2QXX9_9NEOP|nr:unnamed protein product [Danaus chrysippus]
MTGPCLDLPLPLLAAQTPSRSWSTAKLSAIRPRPPGSTHPGCQGLLHHARRRLPRAPLSNSHIVGGLFIFVLE